MATIVEGLTAAQCWTCDRFYGLFFGETVSLEMGNRIPKLRPPLGNPDTEERAWWLASDRLGLYTRKLWRTQKLRNPVWRSSRRNL